ncbi:DMT family transporter [Lacipirellula limnantheis]|uniref:EamA-like transporter family protein n=1 Tax=Lacipirellula limnantheis TaxID=2528024 RepID=A0A517U2P5_9BACT|nr:DMT family transporter [Lacipirellula limnantheis]QDT74894.1 EamA-like transporter family protein [Lacipirellula limnantheis]
MPYLAFLFICLCWGTSFILMHRAALAFGPAEIGLWRMTSGAATIAVYCLYARKWTWLTAAEWRQLAIVAFFCNAYPYVVQPFAMRSTGEHGFIGMMVTLVPIATIAAVAVMLRQWPSPRQWFGVLGGLGCAALIVFDGTERGIAPWLLAMALSSPISYAIGNTYLKWKLSHLSTAPLTVMFLLLGAAFVVPFEYIAPLRDALHLGPPSQPQQCSFALASLLLLGVGSTGVAILLFVWLVQTQGPLFAGMVTYVVPMIALLWGQVDGERLTSRQLAAIGGALAMVAIVQWRSAKPVVAVTPEPPA